MQDSSRRAEQEWYDDLEHAVRVDLLAAAFLAGGNADADEDAREGARALLDEPSLRAMPMKDFMVLSSFIEAGWEFCLGELIAALDGGTTLREHVTRLVARRLQGVVSHFGLSPAEILALVEADPAADTAADTATRAGARTSHSAG